MLIIYKNKKRLVAIMGFFLIICLSLLGYFFQIHRIEKIANNRLERSRKYRNQNRIDKAVEELKEAIKIKPDFYRAWYGLGIIEETYKFNLNEALKNYSVCSSINPHFPSVFYALSRCSYENKDYIHAQQSIIEYIKLEPTIPEGYYCQGIIYSTQHKWDLAINSYLKTISLGTVYKKQVYYNLAYAYTYTHNYDDAISFSLELDKLCAKEDTNALNIAALNYIYKFGETNNQKLLIKAEQITKESLKRNPNVPYTYFVLGLTYRENNNYKDAISTYKRGFNLLNKLENKINFNEQNLIDYAHVDYGWTLHKMGQKEKAIDELKTALQINPNNAEALCCLGTLWYQNKDYNKAIEMFEKCITIAPEYPEPYNYLANYYYYINYDLSKYQIYWEQYCQLSSHHYIPNLQK